MFGERDLIDHLCLWLYSRHPYDLLAPLAAKPSIRRGMVSQDDI